MWLFKHKMHRAMTGCKYIFQTPQEKDERFFYNVLIFWRFVQLLRRGVYNGICLRDGSKSMGYQSRDHFREGTKTFFGKKGQRLVSIKKGGRKVSFQTNFYQNGFFSFDFFTIKNFIAFDIKELVPPAFHSMLLNLDRLYWNFIIGFKYNLTLFLWMRPFVFCFHVTKIIFLT